jgi:hypothetical protein
VAGATETGVRISALPSASLPLSGAELIAIVQDGTTRKAPVSSTASQKTVLGGEQLITLSAGTNNDVSVNVSTVNRILCDTSAGAATLTGWTAGTDGQIMIVTNAGSNNLSLPNQTGSSVTQQIYSAINLTLFERQSRLFQYSGILQKWVLV